MFDRVLELVVLSILIKTSVNIFNASHVLLILVLVFEIAAILCFTARLKLAYWNKATSKILELNLHMHVAGNSFFKFPCKSKAWKYRHEWSKGIALFWPPAVQKYIRQVVLATRNLHKIIHFYKCINFIIIFTARTKILFNVWQWKQIRTK
jgi:hypothetical protein